MSNNVHVYYEQMKTNHSDIKDNNFLWQQPSKMNKTYINSVVELSNGSYNVVENNTINGSADGVCCDRRIGADHSIGLINESNDVVSQNKASNNWFLGMETVGRIENSLIDNNFIDNTGAGGIGSVYLTSWINNTVSNNQVNDSGLLFNFDRENGLLANESAIYFKDNNFINNSFRNYNGFGEGNSASFHFQPPFSLQTSAERQPAASEIILSNNLFQENDFNKNQPAPIFYPVGMVKDGGGNICGKSNIVPYPLSCN
jgi:parallel beta-helix repeat protein